MGTDEEILLWMLLACLTSYLSLSDADVPCFTNRPNAETYRHAIAMVMRARMTEDFEVDTYLNKVVTPI